jgi:hypothetical protein
MIAMNNIEIPRFVKLVSPDHISLEDARLWYQTVLKHAPQGVLSSINMVSGGKPADYRVIRRDEGKSKVLIIPLTRDLLPDELERISNAWMKVCPSGKFAVRCNTNQADKLDNKMQDITMPREEYLSLCVELAKRQHESWMRDKADQGWRYGPTISISNKTHPMMRPWSDLPDQYKDVNTDHPENFLNFLNNQGYAVVRKEELGSLINLLRGIR